jgi:aminopeptidase N
MRDDAGGPSVRLSDYAPPAWLVDSVHLTFRLAPRGTRVLARIAFRPNPAAAAAPPADLVLDGRKLRLISAAIDGSPLPANALATDPEGLRIPAELVPQRPFTWHCETEIDPVDNTALEGLYMSNGMYCTQCEAEGFRKITWFPDRPDVMAEYRVRIEDPSGTAPVLLSNGNPVARGPGWAEWHDPFPKPSYLFALVAGDLHAVRDRFTTRSGRDVTLEIWVRDGDQPRCGYAMDALKRAMAWDEAEYGLEYDLDLFMIVAVDDFNMGAMENKGLNIFNSRYVLASPETATDTDYKNIEAIIAHEYFHNWTGNRITCRDWFQLCLKEGLTVFRDQQFSADMRSAGVKRIEDVLRLRAQQFREDAGPLAHPVRPAEYIEINNFYTATVYEKGAELIRMLRLLVGPETWRRALDLWFARHDGRACTVEDWLRVFEDASGRDLTQFARWYTQAGTPRLTAEEDWDGTRYTLRLSQSTPPTPGQLDKAPLVVPVAYGLMAQDGRDMAAGVLELTEAQQAFTFDLPERPVPSLLRGFSAPVILDRPTVPGKRAFLFAADPDPFNRWEAGRGLALSLLTRLCDDPEAPADPEFLAAVAAVARDDRLDPAFKALALTLPSEDDLIAHLAGAGLVPDPLAVHRARRALDARIAAQLAADLAALYRDNAVPGPYTPDATAAGRRALRARALALLTRLDPAAPHARAQYAAADNMTERMTALTLLVAHGRAAEALADFHARWHHDRLVLDKWFAVQAGHTPPEAAVATVEALTRHPDFDLKNPNRLRSLIGAFAMGNPAGFHAADGSGYRLVVDWLIRLDPVNPQTTARLAAGLGTWRLFDADRRRLMRDQLERLATQPALSRDSAEIVGRLLQTGEDRG